MKKLILSIVAIIILGLNSGFTQNRFENINSDTLEYIIIKYQEKPGIIESKKVIDKGDINEIVTFLKQTRFDDFQSGDKRPDRSDYIFWINLGGWFEKIYFFEHDAFIAKSQFNIDKQVVDELKAIYNQL